jgi:phospholipid N-methyltransferase
MRDMLKRVLKAMLGHDDRGGYIDANETVRQAEREGLSVCDYVERLWEQIGATKTVVDRIGSSADFRTLTAVCEIGPGTGRYLEKIIAQSPHLQEYGFYEVDEGWAAFLVGRYGSAVRRCRADGRTLSQTKDESVDLVHAHGVFTYIPALNAYEYFFEMIRVCRVGGFAVFDVYDDADFTLETIRHWLVSSHRYPVLMNTDKMKSLFAENGFSLIDEFTNKYGESFSRYFVFKKTR